MKPEAFTEVVSEVMKEEPGSTTCVLLGRCGTGQQVAVVQGGRNTLVVASDDVEDNGYYRGPCNLSPYARTGMLVTAMTFAGPIEVNMFPSQNNDSRAGSVKHPGADTNIVLGVFQQTESDASAGFTEIPLATSRELAQHEGPGWKVLQEQQDLALHPEISAAAITELEEYLKTEAGAALRENIRVGLYGVRNHPLSPDDLPHLPAACKVATIVSQALGLPEAVTISYNCAPPGGTLGLHSDSATQAVATLAGQGEMYIQDRDTKDVHRFSPPPNSIIHLESGTPHAVQNTGEIDRWSLVVSS